MLRASRLLPTLAVVALLGACGSKDDGEPLQVAFIGAPGSLFDRGLRLSPPAQQVRLIVFASFSRALPGNPDAFLSAPLLKARAPPLRGRLTEVAQSSALQ